MITPDTVFDLLRPGKNVALSLEDCAICSDGGPLTPAGELAKFVDLWSDKEEDDPLDSLEPRLSLTACADGDKGSIEVGEKTRWCWCREGPGDSKLRWSPLPVLLELLARIGLLCAAGGSKPWRTSPDELVMGCRLASISCVCPVSGGWLERRSIVCCCLIFQPYWNMKTQGWLTLSIIDIYLSNTYLVIKLYQL